jgi:hypothetical protein
MLINKVNELEPGNVDRQKQMLNNAILNNWKSVYPLKDRETNQTAPQEKKEEMKRYGGTYIE